MRDYNKGIKDISEYAMNQMIKASATYIMVEKDGTATCDSCGESFTVGKTKHLESYVCPCCGKRMTIHHTWRSARKEQVNWFATATALDADTLMIRYHLVFRHSDNYIEQGERARLVIDFAKKKSYKFENSTWSNEGWKKGSFNFFREYGMGYTSRRLCCLFANEYKPLFMREVKKINAFKHLDLSSLYVFDRCPSEYILAIGKNADLYEKLQKVGMNELVKADMASYYKPIRYNSKQTELTKMLGINKAQLNILREHQTTGMVQIMQEHPGLPENVLSLVGNMSASDVSHLVDANICTPKVIKYLTTAKVSAYEYVHYFRNLVTLGYSNDKSYKFPKDFKKMDKIVADAVVAMQDAEKDSQIKAISDGLRKIDGLQKFFNGSKGLLVYVPESSKDLRDEGMKLHNCIGTYVDRIANKKTLVFFVRELNNPSAPFVAFEYCNGEVIQCRYDNNVDVETSGVEGSDKIVDFVRRFAQILAKNKVLAA